MQVVKNIEKRKEVKSCWHVESLAITPYTQKEDENGWKYIQDY